MRPSRGMAGLVAVALLCAGAWGSVARGDSALLLQSKPASAYLDIVGPTAVSGAGPVQLSALPFGKYRYTAQGPGMAMSRGRFTRDATGLRFRGWAGPTAMVVPPGLTHLANGEGRGWYYLGGAVLAGCLWYSQQQQADDARDRMIVAQRQIDAAEDPVAIATHRRELTRARDERRDERRIRNIWTGYLATLWLSAGVEGWLMTPRPEVALSDSGQYVATFPATEGWSTALKSALVPGTGQRAVGHTGRATFFSTAIAATMAGAILAQDQVLAARRDYYAAKRQLDAAPDDADTRPVQAALDAAKSDEDASTTQRSVLLGMAASLYLWNVIDAYVGGHRVESAARAMAWRVAPAPGGLLVTVSWRLP